MNTKIEQPAIEVKENTNFYWASVYYDKTQDDILSFGQYLMYAIDTEDRTIREMSILKCGDVSLEDRMSRWVQAARWQEVIQDHPLAESAETWLTPSHYTELYRQATIEDTASALELMEQCFIRNVAGAVIQARPVEWLRGKRQREETSTAELFHRLWRVAAKAINDALSEVERKGSDATKEDRRRVRVLRLVMRLFQAEEVSPMK